MGAINALSLAMTACVFNTSGLSASTFDDPVETRPMETRDSGTLPDTVEAVDTSDDSGFPEADTDSGIDSGSADTGSPDVVDDTDTGTPGTVTCGISTCAVGTKGCCHPPDGGTPFCGNTCVVSGWLVTCDDRADCIAKGKPSFHCCKSSTTTIIACREDCGGDEELP